MTQNLEFTLRLYVPTDAEAVVAIMNAASAQTIQARQAVIDGVGNIRLTRYVPLSSQKVVVVNQAGEILAYAYLVNADQYIVYEMGGAVHPDYQGRGIGTSLLNWAEDRASTLSAKAPAGVKTVLQVNIFDVDRKAIDLFSDHAFRKVREWMHLVIDLNAPPALDALHEGLHLREMDLEQDWKIVGSAMEDAFADHWGDISLPENETVDEESEPDDDLPEDESYSNAAGFCFLMLDQDRAVGGVLCNNKLVERDDTGRIGSLFVRSNYRRQGIGRALMLRAFHAFWQHGIHRIITDTDAESFSEAPSFYTQLGMREYRRELLYEKTIRSGDEVRRLRI